MRYLCGFGLAFLLSIYPAEAGNTPREITIHNVAFALALSVKCPEWKFNIFAVTADAGDVTGHLLTQEVDKAVEQIKTISNPCEVAGVLFGPKGGIARNWLVE